MGLIGAGLLLFAIALGLAGLVLPPQERQALRTGPVDRPGGRKDHGVATPLTGGIAILLAVAVPSVIGVLLAAFGGVAEHVFAPEILEHLPGIRAKAGQLLTVLLGTGVLMVLGHLDDRRGLSPWLRLLVQTICAGALVAAGLRVTLHIPDPTLQVLVTVAFVVFVTNAMNFIDNMNGLMAGVVLIGSLTLLVYGFGILLALAGAGFGSSVPWFPAVMLAYGLGLAVAGGAARYSLQRVSLRQHRLLVVIGTAVFAVAAFVGLSGLCFTALDAIQ
jgi:UDP-N-acetylmuramyl pentapeptide phosphotransferase/UDP-N-acetylglucosamine-1-phosphate transferase